MRIKGEVRLSSGGESRFWHALPWAPLVSGATITELSSGLPTFNDFEDPLNTDFHLETN
jgi:hypothetical protein